MEELVDERTPLVCSSTTKSHLVNPGTSPSSGLAPSTHPGTPPTSFIYPGTPSSSRLINTVSSLGLSSSLPSSRLISTSPHTRQLDSPIPPRRGVSCRVSNFASRISRFSSNDSKSSEVVLPSPRHTSSRNRPNPSSGRRSSYMDVEIEIDGCGGTWFCHPQKMGHRFIVLMLMSLLGFGSYFCFDNPGALQREMKATMNITTTEFANLYSFYSWPNVVLPVIGGVLVDRCLGMRMGTFVFSMFLLIGQAVVSLGAFMNDIGIMQTGRFIFGIGGESLAVAQNTYAVAWFKGRELNMVFGFQLSIARVGSTVNFITMGPIYDWIHQMVCPDSLCPSAIGYALIFAGSTCFMSFLCSILLGYFDKRREQLLQLDTSDVKAAAVKITDLVSLPVTFWLLCTVCVFYYTSIFSFLSLGQDFFISKFSMNVSEANFVIGLPYLISAPASPLLGLLVDKTGHNLTWCFIAILGSIGCHLMVAFTTISPYISISSMGLAYSLLASSFWPMAALMVPEYQLGTAYGIMQAMQNFGLALFTLAAGIIVDQLDYDWLELFFLLLLCISLVCIVIMWVYDCQNSGYLNMSIAEREAYNYDRMEEAEESPRSSHHLLQPRSDSELRNRYLSRIGARIPPHLKHTTVVVPRQFITRIRRNQ